LNLIFKWQTYSAVGAGDARDAAASPRKNLGQNLGEIWAKIIKTWANLIRFG